MAWRGCLSLAMHAHLQQQSERPERRRRAGGRVGLATATDGMALLALTHTQGAACHSERELNAVRVTVQPSLLARRARPALTDMHRSDVDS
jgi:hypothetical protein